MSTGEVAGVLASIDGIVINETSTQHGYIFAETEHVSFYLTEGDKVRITARKTFDRWANSTDWVTRWPLDERDVRAVVVVANDLAQKKSKDDWSIGEDVDVSGLLRKAKRELA